MDQTKVKDLDYYLSLRYRIVLTLEEEGWSATVPDLPGCIAADDSKSGTLELLEGARRSWLEASLERGLPVPEPADYTDR
jgi:antitoxin HicB